MRTEEKWKLTSGRSKGYSKNNIVTIGQLVDSISYFNPKLNSTFSTIIVASPSINNFATVIKVSFYKT